MAVILSLETSAGVCSVAMHEEGKLLATSEFHIAQSHASKLALLIDEVKKNRVKSLIKFRLWQFLRVPDHIQVCA